MWAGHPCVPGPHDADRTDDPRDPASSESPDAVVLPLARGGARSGHHRRPSWRGLRRRQAAKDPGGARDHCENGHRERARSRQEGWRTGAHGTHRCRPRCGILTSTGGGPGRESLADGLRGPRGRNARIAGEDRHRLRHQATTDHSGLRAHSVDAGRRDSSHFAECCRHNHRPGLEKVYAERACSSADGKCSYPHQLAAQGFSDSITQIANKAALQVRVGSILNSAAGAKVGANLVCMVPRANEDPQIGHI